MWIFSTRLLYSAINMKTVDYNNYLNQNEIWKSDKK